MSADRHFKWYLVVDAKTNETVARELAAQNMAVESEVTSFTDKDGRTHSGWMVEYSFINALQKSRKVFDFEFKVFVQEGKGAIREFPAFKKRLSRKAMQAAKDLAEMKQRKAANHK